MRYEDIGQIGDRKELHRRRARVELGGPTYGYGFKRFIGSILEFSVDEWDSSQTIPNYPMFRWQNLSRRSCKKVQGTDQFPDFIQIVGLVWGILPKYPYKTQPVTRNPKVENVWQKPPPLKVAMADFDRVLKIEHGSQDPMWTGGNGWDMLGLGHRISKWLLHRTFASDQI